VVSERCISFPPPSNSFLEDSQRFKKLHWSIHSPQALQLIQVYIRHRVARGWFLLFFHNPSFESGGLGLSPTWGLWTLQCLWLKQGYLEELSWSWTLKTACQILQQGPTDGTVWTPLDRVMSWAWSTHYLTNGTQHVKGGDFTSPILWEMKRTTLPLGWSYICSRVWRDKENLHHL
jgi:hypothetical protein